MSCGGGEGNGNGQSERARGGGGWAAWGSILAGSIREAHRGLQCKPRTTRLTSGFLLAIVRSIVLSAVPALTKTRRNRDREHFCNACLERRGTIRAVVKVSISSISTVYRCCLCATPRLSPKECHQCHHQRRQGAYGRGRYTTWVGIVVHKKNNASPPSLSLSP